MSDNRERNEYWGRLYHAHLVTTGSKETARAYACSETLRAFGSTPFAKREDPRPLSVRDPSDPLGRTYGQMMRSAMEERACAFRARWDDRIRLYTLTAPDEGIPRP